MNAKVNDLMSASVVTAEPHHTVAHVRKMLERNRVGAVPVVDTNGLAVGIVSATDLLPELATNTPIKSIMTEKVYCVSQYDDVSVAARVMRNHKIHRVVVSHEQHVVGVISSFDLLKLVEDHRFVAKNPPTARKRGSSRAR